MWVQNRQQGERDMGEAEEEAEARLYRILQTTLRMCFYLKLLKGRVFNGSFLWIVKSLNMVAAIR